MHGPAIRISPTRRAARLTAVLLLAALGATALGCGGPHRVHTPEAEQLAAIPYPEDAQRGPDLDIVIVREGSVLRLVNRTPDTYRNVQLWINHEYVNEVEHIAVGRENRFYLTRFINRYQEPFPIGGLLTPDRDRPVALVEIYDPAANVRYPLVGPDIGE